MTRKFVKRSIFFRPCPILPSFPHSFLPAFPHSPSFLLNCTCELLRRKSWVILFKDFSLDMCVQNMDDHNARPPALPPPLTWPKLSSNRQKASFYTQLVSLSSTMPLSLFKTISFVEPEVPKTPLCHQTAGTWFVCNEPVTPTKSRSARFTRRRLLQRISNWLRTESSLMKIRARRERFYVDKM